MIYIITFGDNRNSLQFETSDLVYLSNASWTNTRKIHSISGDVLLSAITHIEHNNENSSEKRPRKHISHRDHFKSVYPTQKMPNFDAVIHLYWNSSSTLRGLCLCDFVHNLDNFVKNNYLYIFINLVCLNQTGKLRINSWDNLNPKHISSFLNTLRKNISNIKTDKYGHHKVLPRIASYAQRWGIWSNVKINLTLNVNLIAKWFSFICGYHLESVCVFELT